MNKLAVITGGSRGLGRAAAIGVAQRGTDVVLTYVSKADEAQAVVKEVEKLGRKAVALRLDVGDAKTFPQFAETLKRGEALRSFELRLFTEQCRARCTRGVCRNQGGRVRSIG